MRGAALLLAGLLLGACHDEPDFDTRYDKAAQEIDARARALDADVADAEAEKPDARTPAPPPS